MPRGRPRKVPLEEHVEGNQSVVQRTIAQITHEYCSIPGCTVKIHMAEAQEIIDSLYNIGYTIKGKD